MTQYDDEVDDASRAVLDDLFAAALTTPDPGSKVDLTSILAAARAGTPAPPLRSVPPVDELPTDHDAVRRRSRRVRVFQTLGGVAAAAALVFGVVQIMPSSTGDSAAMTEAPARAAEEPATEAAASSASAESAEASAAEAAPAPLAVPQEDSALNEDSAGGAESGESATACLLPPAAVLDAAVAAAPDWTVAELTVGELTGAELSGGDGCLGFRLVGPTGEFDVLLRPGTEYSTAASDALASASGSYLVQAVPVPGATPDSVDLVVASAVVAAVVAAAG